MILNRVSEGGIYIIAGCGCELKAKSVLALPSSRASKVVGKSFRGSVKSLVSAG